MNTHRTARHLTICIMMLGLAATSAETVAKPAPRRAVVPTSSAQIIPLPLKQIIPAAQRLCTAKTASGLGYRVLRAATGPKPAEDAAVTVNYIGYLAANGEVFDQATEASFGLKRVIPGFSEGLALMPAGSIYRLCIPATQGYGERVAGPIPANSDLVFQVELLPTLTSPAKPG
ncbi:MAG: FKBP-type peptidyl-prolyl cis-trans isomerase [Sphingomonadales bacterium]|nr:FKBP-type peptidyl-prolyl cis-trans isomerase [Sphingomonadales bacterium]